MTAGTLMQQAAYWHQGRQVPADAFYAVACDPRRSVAVEACAGAGKTWVLVSRILRALLDGARPQDILAITFTRKAAGEMRQRLHEWLREFSLLDASGLRAQLALRGLPEPTDEQVALLSGLYARLLATGRPVEIRTFHSWFAALLRSAPLAVLQQLELPLNYELLEDNTQARAQVWRRFYVTLAGAPQLRADYEASVAAYGRSQTRKALEAALDKRVEFVLADAAGVVEGAVRGAGDIFPALFADAPDSQASALGLVLASPSCRELLADAALALGRSTLKVASRQGAALEQALTAGDVQGVFDALLTGKGEPRKFSDRIDGAERVAQAQDRLLQILLAERQQAARAHQERMTRLTRALLADFAALKGERGWVDMQDVESAAVTLLGDELLSGWLQERLDAQVSHLLIDEFQDTNPLQWQALLKWLTSYGGAGRAPGVFIVGDPKQSIYRFRRAEPKVFADAQQFVVEGLQGEALGCDHTRRNAQRVIESVNAAMAQAVRDDGYAGFRAHTSSSGDTGACLRLPKVPRPAAGQADDPDKGGAPAADLPWRDSLTTPRELPEETLRTLEARQAARWIAGRVAAGVRPEDVMVLARKRSSLAPMLDALRALHLPARLGEKTALIEAAEVQDVVALLDVLVSPRHDLSLARALRSPVFGLGDDALVALALRQRQMQEELPSGGGSRIPWWTVLQAGGELPQPLQQAARALQRYRAWLDALPPHDALDAIFHDADLLARFAAAAPAEQRETVLANLQALLAVSLQIDGARFATPYAFVRALKAGTVQAPANARRDAVQLLTVHGAKGLEADIVVLLDTDAQERNADSMGVLVDWPAEAGAPRRFVFLASESRPPACCNDLLQDELAARRREELNGLYVAMTRARRELVVSAIEPWRPAPGSWWSRLEPLCNEVSAPEGLAAGHPAPGSAAAGLARVALTGPHVGGGRMPASPAAEQNGLIALPVLPPLHASLRRPAEAPPRDAGPPGDDTPESRVGQALHRLLQWGAAGPSDFARLQVDAVARAFSLDRAQAQAAADMARRILRGQGAWAWDASVVNWESNEVPVSHQGSALRLDRLVRRRDTGEWWVLDYKSAARPLAQSELVMQLTAYRDAVQAIHPDAQVRAAFLTGQGDMVTIG